MVIVIVAIIAFAIGILLVVLDNHYVFNEFWAINTACPLIIAGGIVAFYSFVFCASVNSQSNITHKLQTKYIERLGIEQNYEKAMKTTDKHRQMSALAMVVAWNEEVETYKRRSKNPIIGDYFPDEVAENLQYIDLESEDLCTD